LPSEESIRRRSYGSSNVNPDKVLGGETSRARKRERIGDSCQKIRNSVNVLGNRGGGAKGADLGGVTKKKIINDAKPVLKGAQVLKSQGRKVKVGWSDGQIPYREKPPTFWEGGNPSGKKLKRTEEDTVLGRGNFLRKKEIGGG